MIMGYKQFGEHFPMLTFPKCKKKGRRPTHFTIRKRIKEYEEEIAESLMELGFKVDQRYSSTRHDGFKDFIMIELMGYDKLMKPIYKINESVLFSWAIDWW